MLPRRNAEKIARRVWFCLPYTLPTAMLGETEKSVGDEENLSSQALTPLLRHPSLLSSQIK